MRRIIRAFSIASLISSTSAPFAQAADVALILPPPVVVVLPAPRRQLTTYMAKYPFGVLREDYTPLGAPGVSKRDYFGVPRLYATLHVSPRRLTRHASRRVVVSARY